MIQTTIKFKPDGTIIVEGAPGPFPCYEVAYGMVSLTEEQAETARRLGWKVILGRGNGELAVVERSVEDYKNAVANIRSAWAAGHRN